MASINVIRAGYGLYSRVDDGNPFNPVDAQTIYFGGPINSVATAATNRRLYIPYAGTIIAASVHLLVAGTLSSGEDTTVFIRLNDTSNTTVATTLESNAINNEVSNQSLSITVAVGDYIAFGFTFPTFVTNPDTCVCEGNVVIAV